jgi:CubicO group peptidase (beta-lactamase class C family)
MWALAVPGVGIALIDNYQIASSKTFGVTTAGGSAKVGPQTLFQAASISKPVAATGAMTLVDKGSLTLDRDVNTYLRSWRVPDNEFTRTEKVTLRRLASHTAGLNVPSFQGYASGAAVPSIFQILEGQPPSNTPAVRVVHTPGTKAEYSGGGCLVEQLVIMDLSGQPFEKFMHSAVLEAIGMKDSFFSQPLASRLAARAAVGTMPDGRPVDGRWRIHPELAAAGLWTTANDLASFAIEIARSRKGRSTRLLSSNAIEQMFKKVPYGDVMGFFTDDRTPGLFAHAGSNQGYSCLLLMNSLSGQGVSIMTNSDNGNVVYDLVSRRIAQLFNWDITFPRPPHDIPSAAKSKLLALHTR